MSRAGNRQSSVYLGRDGHWHGRVTVGRKDDGSEDRRHVMSKSKATVVAKVRALETLRDEARVPKAGRAWTVEKWLLHWLEEIARPNIRDSSYQAYRTAITKHLLPVIANLRLDRPSCRSWAGRAPPWPRGTSTSPTRSAVRLPTGWEGCSSVRPALAAAPRVPDSYQGRVPYDAPYRRCSPDGSYRTVARHPLRSHLLRSRMRFVLRTRGRITRRGLRIGSPPSCRPADLQRPPHHQHGHGLLLRWAWVRIR